MNHVDAGHRLKQLALQMGGGSDTTRRHGDLAGIGLGGGDQLLDVVGGKVRPRDDDFSPSVRDGAPSDARPSFSLFPG
jgi:hypothetical protein